MGRPFVRSFLTLGHVGAMGAHAMKFMLHHLTGSRRGQTQYFDMDRLSFGTGQDCTVVFDAARDMTVFALHAELAVQDHTPTVRDLSGQNALLLNNRQTVEAALHDGDLLQLGENGPLVRFRFLPHQARGTKPWRYIVADSRDIVVRTPHRRYTSFLHLARHMLSDVARYGSPTVKAVAGLTILAPLLVSTLLGLALYLEYRAVGASERRIAELLSQLETGRVGQAELEERITRERATVDTLQREQDALRVELKAALQDREAARRSQEELRDIHQQLSALEGAQRFAEDIIDRFESGVGLLQGGYGIRETSTGRPLRYQGFDARGYPLVGGDGKPLLTLEGDTPHLVIFYGGTGFLIDEKGTVLSNRHVVRMWEVYEPVKELLAEGFEPAPRLLRIFFPGSAEAYSLEVLAVSDTADLAILRTTQVPKGVTPLKLAPQSRTVRVGEPVIVMSYPGTFDSIMSRLSPEISDGVLSKVGADPIALPEELSRQGLVRPLATQGHVTDVASKVITYEARAGGGSSGGPVLNREGRVIAVNHSELTQIGGMNLGLPVRLVVDHLARLKTGRKRER